VSRLNPDATEGRKHNSAKVRYSEYYYPKYSRNPRFNWDEQILVEQEKALPQDLGGSMLDFGGYFLTCYILRILILHFIISSSCTQCTFLIQGEYCVSVYVFRLY
jgi:hypothetical protein